MYRFHRIARASRGYGPQAMQWAVEVANYINANYDSISVQAFVENFGDVGTVHWYADFEDMATFESFNMRLNADQEYWALVKNGAEFFIEGNTHDTLTQSLG